MKENKKISIILLIIIFIMLLFFILELEKVINTVDCDKTDEHYKGTLRILASSENKDLEEIVRDYVDKKEYNVEIEYAGTLDIMNKLNEGENYDAVWSANSIWIYMLNDDVTVSESKYTSINPVVFGIKKSKAEELGFVGKEIYTEEIVNAITDGKLKFSMSNPTRTNSGASAYLGLLSTLAGNPEVLKRENLEEQELKEKLTNLFTGLERTSGSEEFLEELMLNGDFEAFVTYESSIINMNQKLVARGEEPLYALYPVDGVSISDSPLAYIDNKNENKKEAFLDLQSYILSDEGQKLLQQKGRRTWYGGISDDADKTLFNPDWGIDTTKYISPVKYPSTTVIKLALNLYQSELRKPTHVVFCLDYSASMAGEGYEQLISAMQYILTEEAANDFLQFSEKDKIDVIPFGKTVMNVWKTDDGSKTDELVENIKNQQPVGTTALYPAAEKGLELLQNEDFEKYNVSIVLMTDGCGNVGHFENLKNAYRKFEINEKEIPIYSIMFGEADKSQLEEIAELSNAKVFDGRTSLIQAFKEVRGYN